MSMQAKAQRTVTFIKGIGSVLHYLEISTGDFYQRYTGQSTNPTKVIPDYTVTPAIVSFHAFDSVLGTVINPDSLNVQWYFNGTHIDPSGTTAEQQMAALFQIITPDGSTSPTASHQLKIKANLLSVTGGVGGVLMARVEYVKDDATGQLTDILRYDTAQVSENDYALHIVGSPSLTVNWPVPSVYDTAKERYGYVLLEAEFFRGVTKVTPATLKWYFYRNNAWTEATASQIVSGKLKVTCDDINSQELIRAVATTSDGHEAADTATVTDVSDPVQIIMATSPADGIMYASNHEKYQQGVNDAVLFSPVLSASGDAADKILSYSGKFNFHLFGPAGEDLTPAAGLNNLSTFKLLPSHFASGVENITVQCETI